MDLKNRAKYAGSFTLSKDRKGREDANNFSVSIELVNKGNGLDLYPDAQLVAFKKIIDYMIKTKKISC